MALPPRKRWGGGGLALAPPRPISPPWKTNRGTRTRAIRTTLESRRPTSPSSQARTPAVSSRAARIRAADRIRKRAGRESRNEVSGSTAVGREEARSFGPLPFRLLGERPLEAVGQHERLGGHGR